MQYIQTVTGTITPESVHFCHCHEHLMISKGKSWEINHALLIDSYEKSLQELRDFHACNGSTIVDAQPGGCNRMADQLAALARESNVQIIASTGFHKMIFYPLEHWIFQKSCSQLYDIFLHELCTGMYIDCDNHTPETSISAKAGIIKCALDTAGLDPQYEKLFHAAADAAVKTHAPMMVHIEKGADPIMLADFLEKQNVPLSQIIFCHMDRACMDLSVHKEIARRGIFLEYDTIGRPKYHSDIREVEIFAELTDAGYENQLLFSLDTTRERLKSYTPDGVGLTYIIRTFVPMLKAAGFTKEQITKFSCTNCRRALAIK